MRCQERGRERRECFVVGEERREERREYGPMVTNLSSFTACPSKGKVERMCSSLCLISIWRSESSLVNLFIEECSELEKRGKKIM